MRLNHEVARNLNTHHNTVNKQCAFASSRIARKGSDARIASLAKTPVHAFQNTLAHASSLSRRHIANRRKALRGAAFSEITRCDAHALHACLRDTTRHDERGDKVATQCLREATRKHSAFASHKADCAGTRSHCAHFASLPRTRSPKKPAARRRPIERACVCEGVSGPRPRSVRRSRPGRAVHPSARHRRSAA